MPDGDGISTKAAVALLAIGLLLLPEAEGESVFHRRPEAVREGRGARLTFTLAASTDVEVAVLDAQGKIVRHLAAGMLGGAAAPPEPLRPGLAQDLAWDGTNDANRAAAGGPFSFRVRAGLAGRFDGFLLENPDASGPILAVAVGPGGNVYLFHRDATVLASNWGSTKLKILGREGRHLRAVLPYPANIDPEKIRALDPFFDDQGDLVPHIHNLIRLSFYPDPAWAFATYQSPVVDRQGRAWWVVMGPRLACVAADGGLPFGTLVGDPVLSDRLKPRMRNQYLYNRDAPALALSSDEKYLYLAGLSTGEFGRDPEHRPLPCVFRIETATRAAGEIFLGSLDPSAGQPPVLMAPRGLAVAGGRIYVADSAANRVAVFRESDRALLGQIAVDDPQGVGVDPESGAVYVCAYTGKPAPRNKQNADLIKFDGYASARELYRFKLPKTGLTPNPGVHRIAVDASSRPIRIWVPDIPYSPCRLACIEDDGNGFSDRGELRDTRTPWAEGPRDLSLDRLRGELYVKVSHQKWFRFDEPTGRMLDPVDLTKVHRFGLYMSNKGTQIVPAPDGSLVTMNWSQGIVRLDHDGKPLNWPGRDTPQIPFGGIMNFMERSLALRDGEILALLPNTYRVPEDQRERARAKNRMHCVDVIGADGRPQRTVIWQCTHGGVLRADHRNNIYLAEPLKPLGRSLPEFFDGKLNPPTRSLTPGEGRDAFWNSYMYGSIVKFPPSGGAIWYGKERQLSPSAIGQPPAELLAMPAARYQAHLIYALNVPVEVQGARWVRFGFAPFTAHSGSDTCMCEGAGFDIDRWGRVFYPNLGQFRIEIVDAENNFLGAIGKYGNQDSGGPRSANPKPEIPLGWPLSVVASDTHAYVADTLNRRVVRVRLAAAAEETVRLPAD